MIQKIYIIAGESSGDLHGSNLAKELLRINPEIQLRGWGGNKMVEAGVDVRVNYEQYSFMGFIEVIKNIGTILNAFKITKTQIQDFQPDALILIDYPGFNLRMTAWAKKLGIRVYYYISPQIWAWKENRIKQIKKNIDKLFVILPFEESYYARHQYPVYYFGHPLMQVVQEFRPTNNWRAVHNIDKRKIVALFPGSRAQEIQKMLALFLKASSSYTDYNIVIAGMAHHKSLYESIIGNYENIKIVYGQNYDLLTESHLAIVTSGTATLETALFCVPQVVCYKGNALSYWIAIKLVKIKYISLVNLIMDKKIVTELIQRDCTVQKIREEISLLEMSENRQKIMHAYAILSKNLGNGNTSKEIAHYIISDLSTIKS